MLSQLEKPGSDEDDILNHDASLALLMCFSSHEIPPSGQGRENLIIPVLLLRKLWLGSEPKMISLEDMT